MNGPDKTKRMRDRPGTVPSDATKVEVPVCQPTPRHPGPPSAPPPPSRQPSLPGPLSPRRPSIPPPNESAPFDRRGPMSREEPPTIGRSTPRRAEAPTVGRQMTPRIPGAPPHPPSYPAPIGSRPPPPVSYPRGPSEERSRPPVSMSPPRGGARSDERRGSRPPPSLPPPSASIPPPDLQAHDPNEVRIRPPPNVKPGAMIGEKYRVERELGRGGFGVVVRAIHLTLDQRVAIKVLTEGEGSTDAEFEEDAARFRREAKATAALKSEHVVRVLDVDVLDSGYPYIVMEYLEGRTLHDLAYGKVPATIEELSDYMVEVLAALAEAHAAGIVHRDLKPANVFLSKGLGGAIAAKVLDFGVSKMVGAASQRLTRTGAVVGTVAYMAPEQMLDAKRVDGRADLWSVGLVLFEALTRTHPFGGGSGAKAITSILNDPMPSLKNYRTDLPDGYEPIVARLLEKTPERRYPTAVEAAQAIAPFGSPRARAVAEELRRMPQPSGAAAPTPPASSRTVPPPSVAPTGPRASSSKKRTGASLGTLLFAFLAACLVGALLAMALIYLPQRNQQKRLAPPLPVTAPAPGSS